MAVAGLDDGAAHRTLPDALAAVDCDAVVVCTPVELHGCDIRAAVAAGKHVLVEKCLSNDWAEACELVALADEAGVALVVRRRTRRKAVPTVPVVASQPAAPEPADSAMAGTRRGLAS